MRSLKLEGSMFRACEDAGHQPAERGKGQEKRGAESQGGAHRKEHLLVHRLHVCPLQEARPQGTGVMGHMGRRDNHRPSERLGAKGII